MAVVTMHVLIIPRGIYATPKVPLTSISSSSRPRPSSPQVSRLAFSAGAWITTRHLAHRFPYVRHDAVNGVPVYRAYRRAYLPARWEHPVTGARRTYSRIEPLLESIFALTGDQTSSTHIIFVWGADRPARPGGLRHPLRGHRAQQYLRRRSKRCSA